MNWGFTVDLFSLSLSLSVVFGQEQLRKKVFLWINVGERQREGAGVGGPNEIGEMVRKTDGETREREKKEEFGSAVLL